MVTIDLFQPTFMKQRQFFNLTIGLGILYILAHACTKHEQEREPVTDDIYGTYFKALPTTGQWTDYLGGTSIKVRPCNSQHITITVSEVSAIFGMQTVFDSVKLVTDRTFTVSSISPIPSGNSSPPFYPRITGSGSFGHKTISIDFKRIVQENPLLYDSYVYDNAEKTSDPYE